MSTVGERVRAARVGAGLSQGQLADAVGVRRQAVNLWESGKANPTWVNLSEVARVCEVGLDEITQGSPQLEPLGNAPQLKGWVSRRLAAVNQGLNEYLEAVINAEVARRVSEELAAYGIMQRLPEEEQAHVRHLIEGYVSQERRGPAPAPSGRQAGKDRPAAGGHPQTGPAANSRPS